VWGLDRASVNKGRQPIPRGFDLVVDAVHPREPSVKLGHLGGGQAGNFVTGGGGKDVDDVHNEEENGELF